MSSASCRSTPTWSPSARTSSSRTPASTTTRLRRTSVPDRWRQCQPSSRAIINSSWTRAGKSFISPSTHEDTCDERSDMTVVAQGSGTLEAIPRPRSVFQRNLNLVRELSITSFKLKYTGSALGYVWSLDQAADALRDHVPGLQHPAQGRAGTTRLSRCSCSSAIVAWTFFTEATYDRDERDRRQRRSHPQGVLPALDPGRRVDHQRAADLRDQHHAGADRHLRPRASRPHAGSSLLAPLYYLELIVLVLGPLDAAVVALRVLQRPRAHLGDPLARPLLRLGGRVSLRDHPRRSTSSPILPA